MRGAILAAISLAFSAPASAEVVAATANSFQIKHEVRLAMAPDAAFAAFGRVGQWWSPDHSYGGDATRLTLELKPGGCFCEALPGGGVEHMRVAFVDRGKKIVLTGALGPLLYDAVAGVMDVTFAADGTGTKVTLTYKAAGFAGGKADKLAPVVDQVIGEQVRRFGALKL